MTVPTPTSGAPGAAAAMPALAALDLGTNNCRLLVARPQADGFDVIDSFSRIVRLGEGLAASGRLRERAMARTIAALRVCARIMARHQVRDARCVATEACRRAVNGAEFLARVRRATGIELEVLAHEQEARLALLGCLPLIERSAGPALLVDIGGGSTEILWLDGSRSAVCDPHSVSLPIGVVALSEAFTSEPDPATFEAMVRHVRAAIDDARQVGIDLDRPPVQLVGTSGTITTLAAVYLKLRRYDRRKIDGLVLDRAAIAGVSQSLRGMSNAGRAAHPCIGPGRADLVVAGCAILESILLTWPATVLRVADRGLREGILQGLMGHTLEAALAHRPEAIAPVWQAHRLAVGGTPA
jgi:exopolyphosphatase / guanosine-5'-triphosphate,3'-diphosphate pyrophosphatase